MSNLNIENIKTFPYVNQEASASPFNKTQYPDIVADSKIAAIYRKIGHEHISYELPSEVLTSEQTAKGILPGQGFRFNKVIRLLKRLSDGKTYTNQITESKPSSEVLCVRVCDGKPQIAFCLQSRTPYTVEVDGVFYAKLFIEQAAGLVEKGETFEDAARREAREETGYEVKDLHVLIDSVCRHVSYSNETSRVFWANMGEFTGQELDENEDITVKWFDLEDVRKELALYQADCSHRFFGFDVPELTMLSLLTFFSQYGTVFSL